METETYFFDGDSYTPNNSLPVVLYRQALNGTNVAESLEKLFQTNGWSNNWRDIISATDHYHSTTHEVLGVSRGSVSVQIGGAQGQVVHVEAGDVLIIPAGVGHCAVDSKSNYEVVGGYPDGRDWDMIYNETDKYRDAKRKIEHLPLPKKNPVFGDSPIPGWPVNSTSSN